MNKPDDDEEYEDEYEDEEEEYEDEDEEEEEYEDEDEDEEEDEEEDGEEEEEEEEEEDKVIDKSDAHLVAEEAEMKALSPQDIPLNVIVEVGRLQMSIKTLLELKPGNLLELDVHPESGVDLVVNGSRVGKGELVQVGDVLGIRVLELG